MANINEHINVKPEVADDFKEMVEKVKWGDLDVRVRLIVGKTTKALEKFKATGPASTYDLLLENMAMITYLYNRNKG